MSQFTEANGTPLVFELANFTTYRDHEFDTVLLSDVITPPGGQTIQVVHKQTLSPDGEVSRSSFEPTWEDRPRQIERAEVAKSFQLRLSEVIAANSEIYGGDVLGVTSYEVTATLGERNRSYRAAILWIASEPGQRSIEDKDFEIQVVDNVTKGLRSAFFSPPPQDFKTKEDSKWKD